MIKRTVAVAAMAGAVTFGAIDTASAQDPGTYVAPTTLVRETTSTTAAQVRGVQLPRTGDDSTMPLVTTSVGLAAVGAALVVATRRRRNAAS